MRILEISLYIYFEARKFIFTKGWLWLFLWINIL